MQHFHGLLVFALVLISSSVTGAAQPDLRIIGDHATAVSSVRFEVDGLDPKARYVVHTVPTGTADWSFSYGNWERRVEAFSGETLALPAGRYELRLYQAGTSKIHLLDTEVFEIAATAVLPIEIDAPDRAVAGETFPATVRGLNPSNRYTVAVVPREGDGVYERVERREVVTFKTKAPKVDAEIRVYMQGGSGVTEAIVAAKRLPIFADAVSAQAATAYAAAQAAVASGSFLASQFPALRETLTQMAARPDVPATEAALVKATELVAAHLLSWETLGAEWAAIRVGPADLAAFIAKNPDAFVRTFASQVAGDMATSAAKAAAGALVADLLFEKGPLATLPVDWQIPLRAFVSATVSEAIGVAKSAPQALEGDPTLAVGPLLARLRDAHEIYVSTLALARTQSHGLAQVSLGLEAISDLVTRYPSAKHDALADEELTALDARLPNIVGRDDAAATKAVFLAGYDALIAAKHGNLVAARTKIQELKRLGAASNGPTPLSAEGPIDLLLKLIQGEDAPGEAATMLLSMTSLRELETAERISLGDAQGAQCLPAKTSSCGLCEPAAAGLYPPEGGKALRYEWTGGCVNDLIDGYGTLTVYSDGTDRFELRAAKQSGFFFRSGAPILAVPANAIDVRLSSGSDIAEPGTCPNLRSLMIWAIIEGQLQLQADSLADHVQEVARKRALEDCPSLKGESFALQIIERDVIDYFGGLRKVAADWVSGRRPTATIICEGSALSADAKCDRRNFNGIYNDHVVKMRQRYSERVAAEESRRRQDVAAVERRVLEAEATAARQQLEAEISAVTRRAERLLKDKVGTPAELATALHIDERRSLEQLEQGLQLDVEPVEGVRTVQHDGRTFYGVTYRATSLIADVERRHRLQRMEQNFSWNDWLGQTSSVGAERQLKLTCLFDSPSGIPKRQQRVKTTMTSFDSTGNTVSIVLKCK